MAERTHPHFRRRLVSAAFAAGLWLGYRGMIPAEPSVKTPASASVGTAETTGENTAGKIFPPAVRERERALLDLLTPDNSRLFSGEELMRLCRNNSVTDSQEADSPSAYATAWAKQAPEEMHAWFMRRGGGLSLPSSSADMSFEFSYTLFGEWAKKDPDEALRQVLALERGRVKQDCLRAVVKTLMTRDFQKAAAVLREHAEVMAEGGGGFLWTFEDANHEERLSLLHTVPAGAIRGKLMAGYLINMVLYDGPAAERAWKEAGPELRREMILGGFSYSPETVRDHAKITQTPVREVKLENFEALQREIAESGQAPEVAERLLIDRREAWAKRDSPEVVQWALTNLKGASRTGMTGALFQYVTEENFETAETLWRELPDGPLKVHALSGMQSALMNAPPELRQRMRALTAELPEAEARHFRATN